jgi:hypothetical protein
MRVDLQPILWLPISLLCIALYIASPLSLIFAETRKWYVDEHALLTFSAPYALKVIQDAHVEFVAHGSLSVATVAPPRCSSSEATVIVLT